MKEGRKEKWKEGEEREQSIQELWDNISWLNMHVTGVPKEKEK